MIILITFKLVYPVSVNEEDFYAIIEKNNNTYKISLYLGDKMLKEPKEIKAGSLREVLSLVKHNMEKFFFTELKNYVGEE